MKLLALTATVSGVYLFEHPRAWADEMPAIPDPIIELTDADFKIAE